MDGFSCCGRSFANKFNLRKHTRSRHATASPIYKCFLEGCLTQFRNINNFKEHQKSHIYRSDVFHIQAQAFNKTTLVLRRNLVGEGLENFDFLSSEETIEEIKRILCSEIVTKHALNFCLALTINFIKFGTDGDILAKSSPCFLSQVRYFNNVSTFTTRELLHSAIIGIQHRYDDFVGKGSGWSMEGLKFCDLHITQTHDLRGGCNFSLLGNFKDIISRRAGLLNINNKDTKCLLYCIAAAYSCTTGLKEESKSDPNRYSEFVNMIRVNDNTINIEFPISLNDITELERINRKGFNSLSFRINVFREDMMTKKLFLVRSSSYKDGKLINVLLTEFEVDKIQYSHYVLIDKLSFLRKRYKSASGNLSYSKTIFCSKCFDHFRSSSVLESHQEICGKSTHKKIFPSDDKTIHYNSHEHNFKRIFTGYADFESVLEDVNQHETCHKCARKNDGIDQEEPCSHSYTLPFKSHKAISVSFIVVDRYGKLVHEFCYTGKDVVVKFIQNVLKCEEVLINTTKFNKYMIFTEEDREAFVNSTVCHICNNRRKNKSISHYPFSEQDPKFRDHDHLTGKFLGPAHKTCNLNKRREKPFLSVFMHNFSGYDSHLIIPYLTRKVLPEVEHVSVIPKSGEKFMSVRINHQITFLDSMNFLSGSLDSLNSRIQSSCRYKIIQQSNLLKKTGPKTDSSKRLKYLLKKGSFPYEYAKCVEDYALPNLVPPSAFYNSITKSNISAEKYQLAKEVWDEFQMKSMQDYMETYCMGDTLILAEVFEEFRKESMDNFSMDPCHFLSLPGFAYNAFLKQTEVNLEYITDPEIFEMLSSNLRGGHSFCSQRYEESSIYKNLMSSNKKDDMNITEEQQIIYIDANNLYGSAQTFNIPKGGFKFLSGEEKNKINWNTIDLTLDTGFFCEVDLDYPEEIREHTKDFPLCPENIEITYDMLSPIQKEALEQIYNRTSYKQKKLTATFLPKKKIVLHGMLLQLFLQLGMKLRKVHRVIRYDQGNFMCGWVQYCTNKRAGAKTEFEKSFWKLIVNAVYGKTIENLWDRESIKICRSKEELLQAVSKKVYKRQIIVNEDLVLVAQHKSLVYYDKPYYIGFAILEISKYIMYTYFYNVLRKYYGDFQNLQVLYSDTDSFILKVRTQDLVNDLDNLKQTFDFSNLDTNHPLYDPKHKSKLFYFKEEFGLLPILRLVSLGSKVYCTETVCCHQYHLHQNNECPNNLNIKKPDGDFLTTEKLVIKGVSKIAKNTFTFNDYLSCLTNQISKKVIDYRIQSKKQCITSNLVKKVALASFSDKRFILECGIHTKPYSEDKNHVCYAKECVNQ